MYKNTSFRSLSESERQIWCLVLNRLFLDLFQSLPVVRTFCFDDLMFGTSYELLTLDLDEYVLKCAEFKSFLLVFLAQFGVFLSWSVDERWNFIWVDVDIDWSSTISYFAGKNEPIFKVFDFLAVNAVDPRSCIFFNFMMATDTS